MSDIPVSENISDDVIKLPDIPLPETRKDVSIRDAFSSAIGYAFVGLGQAGSRIAEAFWRLGYRRICAVNTAIQDLEIIDIPQERKRLIGVKGAGKDPTIGMLAAREHAEDILDLMEKSFGPEFDRIFVLVGTGGGTGNGACQKTVEMARKLVKSLKIERAKTRVGVIAALPKNSEGQRPSSNSYQLMARLFAMAAIGEISPLVVIDNERIHQIYPGLPIERFWGKANQSIASLFHLFNIIACKNSRYTVFDRADLEGVLDSGIVSFGATPITDPLSDKTNISSAVRDNLKINILAGGMDFSTGRSAACIFIGPDEVMKELPQEHLDYGFETLSRMLARESTIHRGIYVGDRSGLVVYTMIGGLGPPEERMAELATIGAVEHGGL